MKYDFKIKTIDVEAGGKSIVVLNKEDAGDIDIGLMDRVKVSFGKKQTTALVDLSEVHIKQGQIGTFTDLTKKMGLKTGQKITIEPIEKPMAINYIKKKLEGKLLSREEIEEIILSLMREELSDIELTTFITSSYIRGMDYNETVYLTKAILESGTTLKIKKKPILDKHCIGGVPGNRTTMLIVPIVAAAGLTIPKTSSKSVTSPAGTADAMEVLAPVIHSEKKIEQIVSKTNGCIVWGGGVNLAAADDKLIRIRHPLRIDPRGMLLASILAKKKAVGATNVLVDIPIGAGAKIYAKKDAEALAKSFMDLGTKLDMEIHCILTPGYDPIGNAIGPALEARETMRILQGEQVSPDLVEKSLVMSGLLLEMGGVAKDGEGKKMAKKILESGEALKKMKEIIKAQSGDPKIKPEDIHIGKNKIDIIATNVGRIHLVDTKDITSMARAAGAPRDKGAGIYMYVEKGDKIKKGQKLFTIYAESRRKLDVAKEIFDKTRPIELDKVILGEYSTEEKPYVYDIK